MKSIHCNENPSINGWEKTSINGKHFMKSIYFNENPSVDGWEKPSINGKHFMKSIYCNENPSINGWEKPSINGKHFMKSIYFNENPSINGWEKTSIDGKHFMKSIYFNENPSINRWELGIPQWLVGHPQKSPYCWLVNNNGKFTCANGDKPWKNGVPYFETDSIRTYACVSMYVHPHVHMCGIFLDLSCAHGTLLPISFSC
jgi:hypothetical protein